MCSFRLHASTISIPKQSRSYTELEWATLINVNQGSQARERTSALARVADIYAERSIR
jgi:hypothetical protein